jgi:hypothetical protein
MRCLRKTIPFISIAAVLAGCNGSAGTNPTAVGAPALGAHVPSVFEDVSTGHVPPALRSGSFEGLRGVRAPKSAESGLYVTQYVTKVVYGYSHKQKSQRKKGPICQAPWPMAGPLYVAVDGKGNLLEVDAAALYPTNIGTGPQMCGSLATSIQDREGYADAVASLDALNGTIAIANQWDYSNYGLAPGSITVCTVSAGCTANLTNPAMYRVAGVALAPNGDCWASALNGPSGSATLTYFRGCAGAGQEATGYQNPGYGSIDIDEHGNLVTLSYVISTQTTTLYVYSGCNPACKLVGGPFSLEGISTAGALNGPNTKFAVADAQYGQVDIYSYSPTRVKYMYSFNEGLSQSAVVGGVAFNPASPE